MRRCARSTRAHAHAYTLTRSARLLVAHTPNESTSPSRLLALLHHTPAAQVMSDVASPTATANGAASPEPTKGSPNDFLKRTSSSLSPPPLLAPLTPLPHRCNRQAGHRTTQLRHRLPRYPDVPGRLHEHCTGGYYRVGRGKGA